MKFFPSKYVRCLGLLLALVTLTAALAVPAGAVYSDDYAQWKQGDPEWNEAPAWSGSYTTFLANSGCWVTSVSMLLRHYGVVDGDVEDFNPWICAGELAAGGALLNSGDMVLSQVGSVYPGFDCAGEYGFSYDRLYELFDGGYACAVLINGGGHMVAVKDILSDGTVEIMDPGSDKTTLDQCSGLAEIICFGPVERETDLLPIAAPQSTPAVS